MTASPEDFANLIAERLGFTGAIGTKAEIKDGKYTGNLTGKLLHGKEKAIAIEEMARTRNIDLKECFGTSCGSGLAPFDYTRSYSPVGDSHGDYHLHCSGWRILGPGYQPIHDSTATDTAVS